MSNIVLLTGGAKSGKGKAVEELAKSHSCNVVHIGTFDLAFSDDKIKQELETLKSSRPKTWTNWDIPKNIDEHLAELPQNTDTIVIDSIDIYLSNYLLTINGNDTKFKNEDIEKATEYVDKLIVELKKLVNVKIFVVTLEVGYSVVPVSKSGMIFRTAMGLVNQKLGRASGEIYQCICGYPQKVK